MPLTNKGEAVMANMKKEYGPEKGERVFYASRNAGTITGVDSAERDDAVATNREQAARVRREIAAAERQMKENPAQSPKWRTAQEEARRLRDELYVFEKNISKGFDAADGHGTFDASSVMDGIVAEARRLDARIDAMVGGAT